MYFYAFLWFSGIVTDFGPSTKYISEDFLIFFMYFYGLSLGPPGAGPSSNQGSSFEQTW